MSQVPEEETVPLNERPNVFRTVASFDEKVQARIVIVSTDCLMCGFNAHKIGGEKVALTASYLREYLIPVAGMTCPHCQSQAGFLTTCYSPVPETTQQEKPTDEQVSHPSIETL